MSNGLFVEKFITNCNHNLIVTTFKCEKRGLNTKTVPYALFQCNGILWRVICGEGYVSEVTPGFQIKIKVNLVWKEWTLEEDFGCYRSRLAVLRADMLLIRRTFCLNIYYFFVANEIHCSDAPSRFLSTREKLLSSGSFNSNVHKFHLSRHKASGCDSSETLTTFLATTRMVGRFILFVQWSASMYISFSPILGFK